MSRKELIELIERFFSSRRLPLTTLRVEFRATRRPTSVIDGSVRSVWGLMHSGENRVEIFLNTERAQMPFKGIIETLVHELDHVVWEFQGRKFDNFLPYSQRPYEIRARAIAKRLAARF